MLYLKIKDIKIRSLFFRLENKKRIDKYIFINIARITKIKNTTPYLFYNFWLQNHKNNNSLQSKTCLTRRCIFSNRNRSIYRPYGLSRIVLKNFAHFGILPGYKKAIW